MQQFENKLIFLFLITIFKNHIYKHNFCSLLFSILNNITYTFYFFQFSHHLQLDNYLQLKGTQLEREMAAEIILHILDKVMQNPQSLNSQQVCMFFLLYPMLLNSCCFVGVFLYLICGCLFPGTW